MLPYKNALWPNWNLNLHCFHEKRAVHYLWVNAGLFLGSLGKLQGLFIYQCPTFILYYICSDWRNVQGDILRKSQNKSLASLKSIALIKFQINRSALHFPRNIDTTLKSRLKIKSTLTFIFSSQFSISVSKLIISVSSSDIKTLLLKNRHKMSLKGLKKSIFLEFCCFWRTWF